MAVDRLRQPALAYLPARIIRIGAAEVEIIRASSVSPAIKEKETGID